MLMRSDVPSHWTVEGGRRAPARGVIWGPNSGRQTVGAEPRGENLEQFAQEVADRPLTRHQ